MTGRWKGGPLLLLAGSLALTLGAVEIGLRSATVDGSHGERLLGTVLAPRAFVEGAPTDRAAPSGVRGPAGAELAVGDVHGIYRRDPVLGYAPLESSRSAGGWWETDSLGVLRRGQTSPRPPAGTTRVVVLGDSFVRGSRLPLEASWPALLEDRVGGLEVLNLGVDGYGLGQSLLRYDGLAGRIEHDIVLLTVVPVADHWRDLSMSRELAAPGWGYFPINPRFVRGDPGLVRVGPGPQAAGERRPGRTASDSTRALLDRYDRFYVPWLFDPPPVVGRLTLVRWIVAVWADRRRDRIVEATRSWRPDGETAELAREIVATTAGRAAAAGARFGVVVLPESAALARIAADRRQARLWEDWVGMLCGPDVPCLDLAPSLGATEDRLDTASDGTHFGPAANAVIAASVARFLEALLPVAARDGAAGGTPGPR